MSATKPKTAFPQNLALLFKYAATRLPGIDEGDIEHYHRIRNKLYHDGTGLSVDQQYLNAYRSIATILLQNLFGVTIGPTDSEQPTLERLIRNWNAIERAIREQMDDAEIDHGHTYKWEAAQKAGILSINQIKLLTELRIARNRLVHSDILDVDEIAYWNSRSQHLLNDLMR